MTAQEPLDFGRNDRMLPFLPESVTICGDLHLAGKDTTWPPDDPVVTGNMDISCCTKLFFLPANLTVRGNLDIRGGI